MSKPVILTGLRANNDLHIGNYLGALLPLVDMAKKHVSEYQINLFVPDLHSFSTPIDHDQLQAGIQNNLKAFVAAGLPLDNPNVNIYRQSYIPAHSELTVILNCFTGMGEMERMIQYKDKSRTLYKENSEYFNAQLAGEHDTATLEKKKAEVFNKIIDRVSVGLFGYPVLMAADILLYGATYVPVGDDQTQHLEFTRDIAERMNAKFGELFAVPKAVKEQHEFFGKDQGVRVKDLADPAKKMSKSADRDRGVIFMTDTPDEARKKIMSATTDSIGKINRDAQKQPGVTNLLDILELLGGSSDDFIGQEQYGPLKSAVADVVVDFLTQFQSELASVDEAALEQKLKASELIMNEQANATLLKVHRAVGLRP